MATVIKYRIHPAIGIARVGDSDESFDGPDERDPNFHPPNGYRDGSGKIRKQAAKFRIYRYECSEIEAKKPIPNAKVKEITIADVKKITWKVRLGNRKSFFTADRNTRTISVTPEASVVVGKPPDTTSELTMNANILGIPWRLGILKIDSDGRLRVLGGNGRADFDEDVALPIKHLFNRGWYDDVADGPVKAELLLNDDSVVQAESAWVVTSVPDYAHPIECVVSLLDLCYSLAIEHLGYPRKPKTSFVDDIFPILRAAERTIWTSAKLTPLVELPTHKFVSGPKFAGLKSNKKADLPARKALFDRLRIPTGGGTPTMNMPDLAAELPATEHATPPQLSLPAFYYKEFQKWAEGDFDANWPSAGLTVKKFADMKSEQQRANSLDAAHLASMLGGGFAPGIEVGVDIVANVATESHGVWAAPFRIKDTTPPGTLTSSLAVPWHGDFAACVQVWWPSHRPDNVLPGDATTVTKDDFILWATIPEEGNLGPGMNEMVAGWKQLGFLKELTIDGKTVLAETEANRSPAPDP